ncbi:MAG: tetratricopeptide repeat protein [Ktedonobacterales bacterium]
MTQATYQPEEKARLARELTERAIRLALESNWEEAADANQRLLSAVPRDLSALNRLGKALSEIGRYSEAKDAYQQALEIDPTNNIARKNLDRLAQLSDTTAAAPASHERIDPRLFIEETGKTGFSNLVDVAGRDVLARLTAGDQVYLEREGGLLYVRNGAGVRIGRIEARLTNRLIKFLDAGNQYAAGISELNNRQVRIIIRETFQHPNMFGKVSFPTQQASGDVVRGYIKDTMLRRDLDDDDDDSGEGEYPDADDDSGDDDDAHEPDFEEAGFTETEE